MEKKLICVGKFASPHGVRGSIKIKSFTGDPTRIGEYSPLYNKSGEREFVIKILSSNQDMLIVKVDGVSSREEADKLKNMEIYADKAKFDELEEDEFYYDDLIGMNVLLDDGEKFGVVLAVQNFGGCDLIEISVDNSSKSEFFAFTKEIFPEINLKEGYVTICPPEVEFANDNDK